MVDVELKTEAGLRKTVCFVASDSEFLFRHFSPAIKAAKAANAQVYAIIPSHLTGRASQADGIKIIASPTSRSDNSLLSMIREALWFAAVLRKIGPSVVVAYSLRVCLVIALTETLLRSYRFIFVITGVGFIGISEGLRARLMRQVVFRALGYTSRQRTHFVFENRSDPISTGIARRGHQVSILMGAGVDPSEFRACELPGAPPFRFATVSRLIWSKGVDLAVGAVSALAREGYPVELHIYGTPDYANPRPLAPETLSGVAGIHYHGFSDKIASIWENSHAAIFSSRGGEGLPRALLEAAACGRACIVTAVPGCEDFVRNGVEGYTVPVGSEIALKEAILSLITAPHRFGTLGSRARERVLQTSTTAITQLKYEGLFASQFEMLYARAPLGRSDDRDSTRIPEKMTIGSLPPH